MNSLVKKIKTVIVSQRIDQIANRNETRDSLDQELLIWLIESGYLPVQISNVLMAENNSLSDYFIELINPSGIVLSGGNDIGEFPERDKTEFFLIDYAVKNKIPLLGICRGFQMLAKWDGGNLIRFDNHISEKHSLISKENDWPDKIICYHKWGLAKETSNFTKSAHTSDGSIEAIKHNKLKIEGWMWHPERNKKYKNIATSRIKNLFS